MMEPVPQEYQQIQPSLQNTPVPTNHQTTSSFMAQETKQTVDNTDHGSKTTDDEKSQSQESQIFPVKINVLRYSRLQSQFRILIFVSLTENLNLLLTVI